MSYINIKRLKNVSEKHLPNYATKLSSGLDIAAFITEPYIEILPGQFKLIPTGLAIELQDGIEGQIRPRSGLALKHGITVLNTPGTIDSDYRGEMKIILINHGTEVFKVRNGMRIAQLVIAPYTRVTYTITNDLSTSQRGDKGFGSTGV